MKATHERRRPQHVGRWMTHYDGQEAMDSAQAAALDDARAAEVDGHPTPETAAEWLSAMDYRYEATGGGLALHEAAPSDLQDAIDIVRNALFAAACMARGTVTDGPFGSYMPLNTVGLRWSHDLLKLAYDCPAIYRPDWAVEQNNRRQWLSAVEAALEQVRAQWANSDWPWQAQSVVNCSKRAIVESTQ